MGVRERVEPTGWRWRYTRDAVDSHAKENVKRDGTLSADQFLIANFSKLIHLLHSPREANLPRQNDRTLIEGSSIFKAIAVPAFSPPHSAAWAAGESRMGGNRPVSAVDVLAVRGDDPDPGLLGEGSPRNHRQRRN
jgi:hypothetical protein